MPFPNDFLLNYTSKFLIRVPRPRWHSLGTSFKWEDLPYKDCGFTIRFDFFLKSAQSFLGCSLKRFSQ